MSKHFVYGPGDPEDRLLDAMFGRSEADWVLLHNQWWATSWRYRLKCRAGRGVMWFVLPRAERKLLRAAEKRLKKDVKEES